MDNKKDLHIKRLRDGLLQIRSFQKGDKNAWSSDFKSWKQRNQQSLKELFGENHDYYLRLRRLTFCHIRISLMKEPTWSSEDQKLFEDNLAIAESIISDAIEEFDTEPPTTTKPLTVSTTPEPTTQINVNVNTLLSQTMEVQLSQIINNLGDLALPPNELSEVKKLAKELEAESKGKKRWSVLAKSLDALKAMGKAVYERVAIPLLLDMLKKEVGL